MNHKTTIEFLDTLILASEAALENTGQNAESNQSEYLRTLVLSGIAFVLSIKWDDIFEFPVQNNVVEAYLIRLKSLLYQLTLPTPDSVEVQLKFLFNLLPSVRSDLTLHDWLKKHQSDHVETEYTFSGEGVTPEELSDKEKETEQHFRKLLSQAKGPTCTPNFWHEIQSDPETLRKARLIGII